EATEPMVYFSNWRTNTGSRDIVIRTSGAASELASGIGQKVSEIDPGIPVLSVRTMNQQIDNDIVVDRFIATLSSFFGLLALLLAAVGLYGVISYGVTRRTREIGIRMALGAQQSAVLWLVMRRAAGLLLVGGVIGIPGALFAIKLVTSLLYSVGAMDPTAIIAAALALLSVCTIASFLPARRATKVDPMV